MINAISIALSGLSAATKKIAASASNIANLQTAGSLEEGGQKPYTPLRVNQSTVTDSRGNALGVRADYVPKDPAFVPAYDADSPFADENGIIGVPNVSLAEEAVNQIIARAEYKANIATIKTAEELTDNLLKIFDEDA